MCSQARSKDSRKRTHVDGEKEDLDERFFDYFRSQYISCSNIRRSFPLDCVGRMFRRATNGRSGRATARKACPVHGDYSALRAAGASRGSCATAPFLDRDLDARTLVMERRPMGLGLRPICHSTRTASGVGPRTLDTGAKRRLDLGRRPLAAIGQALRLCPTTIRTTPTAATAMARGRGMA